MKKVNKEIKEQQIYLLAELYLNYLQKVFWFGIVDRYI